MDPNDVPAENTAPTEPTQDELEWADAASDFIEEHGGKEKKEEPKDDPVQEDGGKDDTDPDDPKDDEPKDDSPEGEENLDGEPTVRDRLAEERELKQTREAITEDVRQKLFGDKPTRLEDADGDPIETVADVMKLQNPVTGKPFTAEEAASWLMQAQNHFQKQSAKDQAEIEKIVEVNVALKYDLEAIKSEYGELLAAMPKLRQRLSDEFAKTLELGADGDTVVNTKIGMKDFYDMVLAPYVKQAEQMKADAEAKEQAEKDRQVQKKEQEAQQKRTRSDRGDVVATRTKVEENNDPEENEWAKVAKEYYEG